MLDQSRRGSKAEGINLTVFECLVRNLEEHALLRVNSIRLLGSNTEELITKRQPWSRDANLIASYLGIKCSHIAGDEMSTLEIELYHMSEKDQQDQGGWTLTLSSRSGLG
jgi:hypothetical protein